MSDHKPHNGYAPVSLVEAYWDALREGREMPMRGDIDPRGIESALEFAFILERVAPGVARLRIAGSHLHDLMGMEPRGMPITAFFEQEERVGVAGILEEVFQKPAKAELILHSAGSITQPALDARMVLLPLKSDLGDVSRILGCLVTLGDLGAVPRRFTSRDTLMRPVGAAHEGRADTDKIRTDGARTDGFAEPRTPFSPPSPDKDARHKTKERPYLRLVKSDK